MSRYARPLAFAAVLLVPLGFLVALRLLTEDELAIFTERWPGNTCHA